MTNLREKLNQMFILGLEGENYKSLVKNNLGGVIFFTKDIISSEQFRALVNSIKENCSVMPFLAIDQEGGRVERTENIHKGKKYLSAKFAFQKGKDFLQQQTKSMLDELESYGINLNFAPCVDVNTNPKNPIIGERSYSNNPNEVINAAKMVLNVYQNYKIMSCLKHFPGHGDASTDSHLTLPIIDLSLDEMEKTHIKPFKELVHLTDMVMVAHLHCTCFDKECIPTSLSKNAISYLRNELDFNGIIVSDDMVMKGVAEFGEVEACIRAIKAGINLLIYRYSDNKAIGIINEVYKQSQKDMELRDKIEYSYSKIIDVKTKYFGLK